MHHPRKNLACRTAGGLLRESGHLFPSLGESPDVVGQHKPVPAISLAQVHNDPVEHGWERGWDMAHIGTTNLPW